MRRLALPLVALTLAASACGSGGGRADAAQHRTLTVLAASSLTDTFTDLAARFEATHDGVDVRLVLDSSATLAQQAIEGAPGDVLATADRTTMDQARTADGVAGDPRQFATNVVVLAVPKDNPGRLTAFGDLDHPGVDYLTCVPTAPCGASAEALLAKAGIARKPVSQEVDVRSVLAKVASDEADAGLVYRTDVTAADGKVTGIEVPGATEDPNTYWVAVTANATQPDLAAAWIDFLTGASGQAVLKAAGFGTVDRP